MIEKMPESYKGTSKRKTNYTDTQPRQWTKKEIEWLQTKHNQGYSKGEIAYSMDRSLVSISIKLKRLKKKNDKYNEKHLQDKYDFNKVFFEQIKPKSILDLYCGKARYWETLTKQYNEFVLVVSNDKDTKVIADYHQDAFKLLCKLYSSDDPLLDSFDLIDIDPFGSAYDTFDLAIKMAKKGLIITLGELGHKRWKRLDFVSRYYGINDMKDFTIRNLIKHIQAIGLRNKKKLTVVFAKEWENIGRVWFSIEPINTLEPQTSKKKVEQLDLFS